jgi:transposase-like protein
MAKQDFSVLALADRLGCEADAYKFLEELRWENGTVCPHCGSISEHYFLNPANGTSRKTRTGSASQRRVWKCRDCRKQFSVLTGTIFHGTKISLRTWVLVIFEMCASKNGVAAREIERKYNLTAKTAWFMLHRIREAMKREPLAGLLAGTIVADETWVGGSPKNRHRSTVGTKGKTDKTPVFSLIHKESGEVRSKVVPNVTGTVLPEALREAVDIAASTLHTDSAHAYVLVGREFASHGSVNHTEGEYVRDGISTNAAEGYFSQLKRSLDGTQHHVSVEHLPRYLAEHDFRYSTRAMQDSQRMRGLVENTGGRRLTYKPLAESGPTRPERPTQVDACM